MTPYLRWTHRRVPGAARGCSSGSCRRADGARTRCGSRFHRCRRPSQRLCRRSRAGTCIWRLGHQRTGRRCCRSCRSPLHRDPSELNTDKRRGFWREGSTCHQQRRRMEQQGIYCKVLHEHRQKFQDVLHRRTNQTSSVSALHSEHFPSEEAGLGMFSFSRNVPAGSRQEPSSLRGCRSAWLVSMI